MLQKLLSDALGGNPAKPSWQRKAEADDRSAYGRFRRRVKALGWSYKVADDYIELPPQGRFTKGVAFAHYSWAESLERLEYILANGPVCLDEYGGYSE